MPGTMLAVAAPSESEIRREPRRGRVMARRDRVAALFTLAPLVLAFFCGVVTSGCGQPYRGPKRLAGVGAALLVTGGAAWAGGDRADRRTLSNAGFVTTLVGAGLALAAGGWLAASVSCEADFQCPEGETCREIPAPPGATPYRQCMRR